MSKVQVDTIVDKDDISAPTLSKGAIVTGVCTATSFDGAISEWVLGADGTSHYTFTGSGLTGAENDPTLYLKRGQKYRFKNSSGGHPFRIQSTANGSAGTAYNDGVTNNDAGDGTTLEWDVQFDAPSVLYYQCTAHGSMGGKIYIGNSGNSSTLVDLNVSGVTTTGIATVTTSVVVGSAVTANADGVITAGVGTFGSVVSGAISGSTGTFTGDIDIAENIIHTGDTDTKIHFSAADQISFVTGGTTRLNITSGGNLEMPNDTDYIKIGASGDLQLVHTGGVSYISDSGSPLEIRTDTLKIASGVGTEAFRVGGDGQLGVAGANYGTSGQVLTSGGSAASPSWADAAGGAWTSITSGTIDAVDTIITESLDNTYQLYRLNFYAQLNANTAYIGLRIKTGGSWKTDSYSTQNLTGWGSSEEATYAAGTDNRMFLSNRGWRVGSGMVSFGNVDSTTACKVFRMEFAGNDSLNAPGGNGNTIVSSFSSLHDSTTAITGIRFFKDGSAPDAGWYVLEGCAIS